ncbi:MAG: hypothetical protein WAO83_05800 [Fuerstiella sp.]|jgi:hypothetical protein
MIDCIVTSRFVFGACVALFTLGELFAQGEFPVPDRWLPGTIYCEYDREDGLPPNRNQWDPFFVEGVAAAWQPEISKPDPVQKISPDLLPPKVFRGTVQITVNRNYFGPTASMQYASGRLRSSESRWEGQRLVEMTDLRSGPVTKDDLMPVFGWLLKVTRCHPGGGDTADVTLQRLPRDAWPDGVTLDPYAYAVTTGGTLTIPAASISKNGTLGLPMSVEFNPIDKVFLLRVAHELVAEEDGSLTQEIRQIEATPALRFPVMRASGTLYFQVISVVAPDPDRRITGWVEIRRMWPAIEPFGFHESKSPGRSIPERPTP